MKHHFARCNEPKTADITEKTNDTVTFLFHSDQYVLGAADPPVVLHKVEYGGRTTPLSVCLTPKYFASHPGYLWFLPNGQPPHV